MSITSLQKTGRFLCSGVGGRYLGGARWAAGIRSEAAHSSSNNFYCMHACSIYFCAAAV